MAKRTGEKMIEPNTKQTSEERIKFLERELEWYKERCFIVEREKEIGDVITRIANGKQTIIDQRKTIEKLQKEIKELKE